MATLILITILMYILGLAAARTFIAISKGVELPMDVLRLSVGLLVFIPFSFIGGYVLSRYFENAFLYYGGVFLSGFCSLLPLLVLTNLYLLWWNPEKYKEYEMKKRRRERNRKQALEDK